MRWRRFGSWMRSKLLLVLVGDLEVVLDVVVVVGVGFDNVVEVDLLVRISIFFARSNVWRRFVFRCRRERAREREKCLFLPSFFLLFSIAPSWERCESLRERKTVETNLSFCSSVFGSRTPFWDDDWLLRERQSFFLFLFLSVCLFFPLTTNLRWKGWMKFEMNWI